MPSVLGFERPHRRPDGPKLVHLARINLLLLVSYFTLGDLNPMWVLGVGGAERWIAYPILLWAMGFGGYLAGREGGLSSRVRR